MYFSKLIHSLTTPRYKDDSTPNEIPVEIFGRRTPTTPPTNAPIITRVVSNTPKSFIFGSVIRRNGEQLETGE